MNNQINEAGEQLENAFQLFNQFSEKLSDSYADLESRVAQLSQELAWERSERLAQLAEKERLAQRLESLFDALPAGVVVLDPAGTITQTNRIAHEMLQLESQDDEFEDSNWEQTAAQVFLTDGDELRLKDGRWISLSACQLNDAFEKIILISDVSETHALHEMLNHQQRLSSLGEMIASLAHQIRTPLASALLNISNANHPANNEERRIDFTDKARERLHHLERMVDDMLVFARGDVSDVEYVNAGVLCARLKKSLEHDHRSQQIIFQADPQIEKIAIRANMDILLSALQNIIDNAIEACNAVDENAHNKSKNIEIKAFLNDANKFEISIEDSGIGMSEATRERILEPFFTTRANGTGLGLAVVNATVERYHGEISIRSRQGEGSCFHLKFPQAEANGMLHSSLTNTENNPVFSNPVIGSNKLQLQKNLKSSTGQEVVL